LNEFGLRHQLGHLSPPNHFGDDDVSAWHTVPYGGNPDDPVVPGLRPGSRPLGRVQIAVPSVPRASAGSPPRDAKPAARLELV
jgi:hypothetical protein